MKNHRFFNHVITIFILYFFIAGLNSLDQDNSYRKKPIKKNNVVMFQK